MVELDHVVYFSEKSPEVNVQEHKGTTIGGKHKNWGTFNALTYTQNSYIEYLSVEHMNIAKRANHPLTNLLLHDLERGEGWGTICFRTDNILGLNDRLTNEGWVTSGVLNAERETSSGLSVNGKCFSFSRTFQTNCPIHFLLNGKNRLKNV
jgi:hypothetical protein